MDAMSADKVQVCNVNEPRQVAAMLENLQTLPTSPPSFYLLIGGRESVDRMTLMVTPQSKIYVIHVRRLGGSSFTTPRHQGVTLKAILESKTTPKVFFDARGAARLLFREYQIRLDGVHEIQIMELATREKDIHKEKLASFASLVVARGLNTDICSPSARDNASFDQRVLMLPQLWNLYHRLLTVPYHMMFWVAMTREATNKRLREAHDTPLSSMTSQSPWYKELIEEEMERWNDDVGTQAMFPDYVLDYEQYRKL